MRVVYLAAGAADMLCGSCIRDNRLAATLRAMGRDVLLVPLYTPLRSDEPIVADGRVLFGGINVYLRQRSALFRRAPGWLVRPLDSPALLRSVGRYATRTRPEQLGELTVSVLDGLAGPQRAQVDQLTRALRGLHPALVNLPNLMFVGVARTLRERLDVPVLYTLSGEDLFLSHLSEPHRTQAFERIRAAAPDVDGFISLTAYYADRCAAHFALPRERIHVAPMGVDTSFAPRSSEPPAPPCTIAYVGRICRDKGLLELTRALVELRGRGHDCCVVAAGWLEDAAYLRQIIELVESHRCADRFEYRGEVTREQKFQILAEAHLFSMPSAYPEAKGLPVLEAMAAGVPVVQPRHGSFRELVETAGGGVLYDPQEPDGLAAALVELMDDGERRRRLGVAGAAGVRAHYSDRVMAERVWAVYEHYAAPSGAAR